MLTTAIVRLPPISSLPYSDGLGYLTSDGYKGFDIGANVTLAKNIVAGIKYADFEGREDKAGLSAKDAQTLWTEVVFTF